LLQYFLKPDALTNGVITRIIEDCWKGKMLISKEDLQKINQALGKNDVFGEIAEKIYVPVGEDRELEDKLLEGLVTNINREQYPENKKDQVELFPHRGFILKDGIYGSAFGRFNYIYRAKGIRIFWFESGLIEYRAVYSTIDEAGFSYIAEELDSCNFLDGELEDLENTVLQEAFGTGEILISNLIGIKENFNRDYPIEYLLYPRDVDRLSSFSIQLREQIWDAIIDLIKEIAINTNEDKGSLLNYLINFIKGQNIQPEAYHVISLFDFYRENQIIIDQKEFQELLAIVRKISIPEDTKVRKLDALALLKELEGLKPGTEMANAYHDLIFRCLSQIFDNSLKRGKKEVPMDNNRKRVDVVFDNYDNNGFFAHIRNSNQIFCPKIFIECKNYSSDPSNPEVDQLIGRLGKKAGMFGILICRQVENEEILMQRCKSAMNKGQGHIIYLVDEDIKALLLMKELSNDEGINNFLSEKWDQLIL